MKSESDNLLKLAPFVDWFMDIECEIKAVQGLMSERLSDSPAVLSQQLGKIEAWHARMTSLLADANSQLDRAEYQGMMTVDRELTVFERIITLKAKVITERRVRDIILGLCQSIKNRLILGMSSRKQNAGERSYFAS